MEAPQDARNHLIALRQLASRDRSLDQPTSLVRADSASSAIRDQSVARESMQSPAEKSREDDLLLRLIDEILLEEASASPQQATTLTPPPYPVETEISGCQLLEEDDSFYAGRPLRDVDTNDVSDILAQDI